MLRNVRLSILTLCLCIGSLVGLVGSTLIRPEVAAASPTLWSITHSPNPAESTTYGTQLDGVSCTSSTDCEAVGNYYNGSADQTLIESWNGIAWSIASSPDDGTAANTLSGVSCISPTNCEAVGYYYNGSADQTLIESWNGIAWSLVSSPDQGSGTNQLGGVSCTGATNCVAVGYDTDGSGVSQTLIETWDGTAWSITSSPDPGPTGTYDNLDAVSCASSISCMAVGTPNEGATTQTLIESWNGTAWSVTPSPDPGTTNQLYSVSCSNATSCVAVGTDETSSTNSTLVESWNGTAWSVTPSPSPGPTLALSGVSCTDAANCVAVGEYYGGRNQTNQTLIESWNGTTWSVTPSPSKYKNDAENFLKAASCTGATGCIAVGYEYGFPSEKAKTLIETGSAPAPVITRFSPESGAPATVVTIDGSNLQEASTVTFNGVPATITHDGMTKIKATVPSTATTGDIAVTTPGGTPTSSSAFTVT